MTDGYFKFLLFLHKDVKPLQVPVFSNVIIC